MVVAYPSFGDYPDDVDVQNFEDLQDYVLNQIQQPSVVVAQSMGGIFAVQAALKNLSRCRLWYLWQPQAALI
jgi:pimeloyl-ACP methyl ester carboxylesterase